MTVDDSKCAVKYASSGAATATWQDLGTIHSAVKSTANGKYDLTVTLQDVSYSPLRHLISDAYWATPLGASVECNAGVTLYLYHVVPVRLYANVEASMRTPTPGVTYVHYASSGISGTSTFKFSEDFTIESDNDSTKPLSITPLLEQFRCFEKWAGEQFSRIYDQQTLHVQSTQINPLATLPFSSFVVHVPTLSLAATMLGDRADGGRYHLTSSAFDLQLAAPEIALNVDLSLQCSDSFDVADPSSSTIHACTLFDSSSAQEM